MFRPYSLRWQFDLLISFLLLFISLGCVPRELNPQAVPTLPSVEPTIQLHGSDSSLFTNDPTIAMFENVRGPIYSLALPPEGDRLASAGFRQVWIWDMATQDLLNKLDHPSFVWGLAWSPGGSRLAAATQKGLYLWEVNLSSAQELNSGSYFSLAWSPDGRQVAAGRELGGVEIWDVETVTLSQRFEVNDVILSLSWSPGGSILAAGLYSGTAKLFDLSKPEEIDAAVLNTERGGDINGIAWSSDGTRLALARQDGTVLVWDAQQNLILHKLAAARGWSRGLAWSPDGFYLASAGQDAKLRVWNVESGTLEAMYELGSKPLWSLAWSPDGQWIAAGNGTYNHGDDQNTVFLVKPFEPDNRAAGTATP